MWYKGQHVVCVDAKGASMLKKGNTYIISEIIPYPVGAWWRGAPFNGLGFWLIGVPRLQAYDGYCSARFRPALLRGTKTGMEVLRKLLDPANHKNPEGVE